MTDIVAGPGSTRQLRLNLHLITTNERIINREQIDHNIHNIDNRLRPVIKVADVSVKVESELLSQMH